MEMTQIPTIKIKNGDEAIVINESDFNPAMHELCEGEVLSNPKNITISLNTEIAPEFQKLIDDTKAECAKVVDENEVLKKQVEAYQQTELRNSELLSENSRLSDELVKLNGVLVERNALADQVKDLESKLKKQTSAEAKATKAAEVKTEQSKE
jgi:cell shape-determining protein MreC